MEMDYNLMSNSELSAKYEEMGEEFKKAQAEFAASLRRMDEAAVIYKEIKNILIKRNVISEQ